MLSVPWELRKNHFAVPTTWTQQVEQPILQNSPTSLEWKSEHSFANKIQPSQHQMTDKNRINDNESALSRFKPYTMSDIPITKRSKQSKNKTRKRKRKTEDYTKGSSSSSETESSHDDPVPIMRENSEVNGGEKKAIAIEMNPKKVMNSEKVVDVNPENSSKT